MPAHPRSAWTRLGELLMRRRIDIDPRYSNRRTFVEERVPDRYRIINSIELGRRDNYEPATKAALEAAYRLAPGAIDRFFSSGILDTETAAEPSGRPGADILPLVAETDEPAVEGYYRVLTLEREAHIPLRTPQEERIWAHPWLSDEAKAMFIAQLRWVLDGRPRSASSRGGQSAGLARPPPPRRPVTVQARRDESRRKNAGISVYLTSQIRACRARAGRPPRGTMV